LETPLGATQAARSEHAAQRRRPLTLGRARAALAVRCIRRESVPPLLFDVFSLPLTTCRFPRLHRGIACRMPAARATASLLHVPLRALWTACCQNHDCCLVSAQWCWTCEGLEAACNGSSRPFFSTVFSPIPPVVSSASVPEHFVPSLLVVVAPRV